MNKMEIEEYMRIMGFSRYEIEKVKRKRKNCRHRKTEKLKEYRKNYPFGRKSKPQFILKRIWGKRCTNCLELFKPGSKRFHEEDW